MDRADDLTKILMPSGAISSPIQRGTLPALLLKDGPGLNLSERHKGDGEAAVLGDGMEQVRPYCFLFTALNQSRIPAYVQRSTQL